MRGLAICCLPEDLRKGHGSAPAVEHNSIQDALGNLAVRKCCNEQQRQSSRGERRLAHAWTSKLPASFILSRLLTEGTSVGTKRSTVLRATRVPDDRAGAVAAFA